jgi:hypothetical protein
MDRNEHDLGQAPLPSTAGQVRNLKQTLQAAKLQRFAYDAAQALRGNLSKDGQLRVTREDAVALAQLVRAWDTAADRLRILRGKGLPPVERRRERRDRPFDVEPLVKP